MRVSITAINFKYDGNFDQEYTGVELQYITNGFKIGDNTPVEITKEQYEAQKDIPNGLRALVVEKKIAEADAYLSDLNDYKTSLQGE